MVMTKAVMVEHVVTEHPDEVPSPVMGEGTPKTVSVSCSPGTDSMPKAGTASRTPARGGKK